MFSPTLLSEAHFGFSRSWDNEHNLGAGFDTASQLGIQGSTKVPLLEGLPLFTVLNFPPIGYAANEPVQFAVTNIQAGDKFTWVKGSHILKWGVDLERMRFNQPFYNNSRGTIATTNAWTCDSIGDLLLGLPASSTITAQTTRNYLRSTDFGSFFNDDWKLTRSLTLNLGVRYEIQRPDSSEFEPDGGASEPDWPGWAGERLRLAEGAGIYQLQELRSPRGRGGLSIAAGWWSAAAMASFTPEVC